MEYGKSICMGIYINGKKRGERCVNKAYYEQNEKYLCGIHSKKDQRIQLSKGNLQEKKKEQKEKLDQHIISISFQQNLNQKGKIILSKMRMRQNIGLVDGFLNVFPNYFHENRKDGFGCSSLSPMNLGPLIHNQPGLPICLNIENFHQGNKFYSKESKKEFEETRLSLYNDKIPHRRKFTSKDIPLYSLWLDKNGKEHRINYIESRQFYCTFYERLAKKQKQFIDLISKYEQGINLRICGYDAVNLQIEDIEKEYLNPKVVFGHERTLFTMLVLKEDEYPWVKYKTFDF